MLRVCSRRSARESPGSLTRRGQDQVIRARVGSFRALQRSDKAISAEPQQGHAPGEPQAYRLREGQLISARPILGDKRRARTLQI